MRSLLGRFHRPMSRGLVNNMLTMNNLGDGSTLSLDFTTGVLDSRLTFTRSTTATYINSSGYVTTMGAAPTNDPTKARFDYSPTNIGEPRGLLVEGSSTNLLTYSNAMNQNPWFETANVTRTNFTGGNGPDNVSNSGSKVAAANIATGNTLYYNGTTSVSGNTYTYSMWAKADGANWIWLNFFYFGVYHGAFFDLSGNGALGNTTGTIVAGSNTITKYPNGWFRLTVSHTATFTIFYTGMVPCTSNGTGYASIIGQSPNGVLVYGAQVELGSSASSYIPTGASQVTRNADHCTIPTASFIPGNPYPQTLFVDCIPNTPSGAFLDIVRVFDRTGGTFSYGNQIYYYTASTMTVTRKISASTNSERNLASGLAYGTRHKFALSIDASSFSGSYDGVTSLGVATAPTALPTVATHLGIGCTGDSAPSAVMFGTIRQIKFYPTALSQSAINTLTTL